jgi:branched-chain amino acid transport system permease protein
MKKFIPYILLILVLFLPLILRETPSIIGYLNLVMIYGISTQGLNLLLGIGGQISLGHAAFMAIGGYTSAIFVVHYNFPFIIALIISIVVSAIFGLIVGFPSLRLKGFYLAIATMALGNVVGDVLRRMSITGGDQGFRNIPTFDLFGFKLESYSSKFYLILFFFLLTYFISRNFIKSKSGKSLIAMRDSEVGALSVGVNISNAKLLAFILASVFAGLSGVLYAHDISYLHPSNFALPLSIDLLAITIIGGLGTLWGPILASLFWIFLPLIIGSKLELLSSVIFGIVVILVVLFLPRGLSEIIFRIERNLKKVNGK